MSLNEAKIGVLAAELMGSVARRYEDAEVGEVAIVVELTHHEDDGPVSTTIQFRCSDPRRWVQRGLFEAALATVDEVSVSPDD